jgi:hypothetical protein
MTGPPIFKPNEMDADPTEFVAVTVTVDVDGGWPSGMVIEHPELC